MCQANESIFFFFIIIIMVIYNSTTVTGYGGSKLVVRDDSHDVCNTNNEAITVWENATHIANSSECFLKQFT